MLIYSVPVLIPGFTFLPLVILSQNNKDFLKLDNKEDKNGEGDALNPRGYSFLSELNKWLHINVLLLSKNSLLFSTDPG